MRQTLYDKLWDSHVVHVEDDGTALLYIDRHLVHEVTSAQAYEGLRLAGRKPWRTDSVVATADHNTPTTNWDEGMAGVRDPFARLQIETLDSNIKEFGAKVYFPYLHNRQDIVLAIIGRSGIGGGTGYAIEFAGSTMRSLSMEGRMTVCNMAIEAGARAGMVAVDEMTLEYLNGRRFAPKGRDWEQAVVYWRTLQSDPDAKFDREVTMDARDIRPHVTWGTSPEMVVAVDDAVPDPEKEKDSLRREGMARALEYMGLTPRTPITSIRIDKVFIGSSTNSRTQDHRPAPSLAKAKPL